MADYFNTASLLDKAAATETKQPLQNNVQTGSGTTDQFDSNPPTATGSNFSMCEIIM